MTITYIISLIEGGDLVLIALMKESVSREIELIAPYKRNIKAAT